MDNASEVLDAPSNYLPICSHKFSYNYPYVAGGEQAFKTESPRDNARSTSWHVVTMLIMLLAMANGQEWRDRSTEVPSFTLSPPGLAHPQLPPYKSHLYADKKHISLESNVRETMSRKYRVKQVYA